MIWGSFLGQPGDAGEVELNAQAGDIVRWGQRDNRGKAGISEWGIVSQDGEITACTPAAARKHWLAAHEAPPAEPRNPLAGISDAELLAEVARRGLS